MLLQLDSSDGADESADEQVDIDLFNQARSRIEWQSQV
jgi:hypothetical protein